MNDLINRESAIVVACKCIKDDGVAYDVKEAIKNLPSAQPKRGEWIYNTEPLAFKSYGHFRCSLCDEISWDKANYCPNCGADMRGDKS